MTWVLDGTLGVIVAVLVGPALAIASGVGTSVALHRRSIRSKTADDAPHGARTERSSTDGGAEGRLEAVARATRECPRASDANELLHVLARTIREELGAAECITLVSGNAPVTSTSDDDAPMLRLLVRAAQESRQLTVVTSGPPAPRAVAATVGSCWAAPLSFEGAVHGACAARWDQPPSRETRETLNLLLDVAALALGAMERGRRLRRHGHLLSDVAMASDRIHLSRVTKDAAESALRALLDATHLHAGVVVVLRGARLVPIASIARCDHEPLSVPPGGFAYDDDVLHDAWRDRRAAWIRDPVHATERGEQLGLQGVRALVVLPVLDGHGDTRALTIAAGSSTREGFEPWMRSVAMQLTATLGATLQRRQLERRVDLLLDLVRTVAQGRDARDVYDRAVEAVVKLIPGADAASLLVRRGGALEYVAASGYDLEALRSETSLRTNDDLGWYGRSRTDFERGIARRIDGDDVTMLSELVKHGEGSPDRIARVARLPELLANVCVPIVFGGEVLGMMNVDSLSNEEAFGDAEIALAEAFGHQIGVIFEQTMQRERLARVATTDPVTGLDNREGFNRRLSRALSTVHEGDSLHLVMMDLNGFKMVNDRLGHHAGDVALERVARALESASRDGDVVCRWGGDEFAVVIRGASNDDVRSIAERYADVVRRIEVGGIHLGTSVGIATWPDHGRTADDLMKTADAMMYEQKRLREASSGAPSARA